MPAKHTTSLHPTIQAAIDAAYQRGMAQHSDEIVPFAEAVYHELRPRVVLEIGTHRGGTLLLWSLLAPGGFVLSIDLPDGPWGGVSYEQARLRNLEVYQESREHDGAKVVGILDNSGEAKTRDRAVQVLLNGCNSELVDLLFIDGDHSYEGVKRDWHLYSGLVRPGGWCAFHDIIDTPLHRERGVEVADLWREIKAGHHPGRVQEFIGGDGNWGGIGVIRA